jgi:CubicO group peptidase (beta-lactamase class C family)
MTIRDLLRHTSGLTYGFFGNTPVDQKYKKARVMVFDKNLAETISKLGKIPLQYQPGTRFHYSVSTDVLGRVVEVVSKKSFKAYLDENLFAPLEMNDTFFTVPKDKRNRFAEMYRPDGKGGLTAANRMSSYRFLNENELYSGGGGLCSTAGDYLNFCQMLVNDGKHKDKQILKSETIKEMFSNQLPKQASSRNFKFGLGFRIQDGTYFWGGAAGTRFWVDPENKISGVFMIQINPFRGKNYGGEFKKFAYRALEK